MRKAEVERKIETHKGRSRDANHEELSLYRNEHAGRLESDVQP